MAHLRRNWWLAAAVVAVGAFGYWVVEGRTRTGAERVKDMVDWGESCPEVEVRRSAERLPAYAQEWKSAEERAIVVCRLVGDVVYARFPDAAALRRDAAASPPVTRMCSVPEGRGVETVDGEDRAGRAFRVRCRRRHGRVDEWTDRYCVAGDELVVDGLDDDREFRELCRELDGRLERPPASVLAR